MDTRDNIRLIASNGAPIISPDELREQFVRDEEVLIRCATEDVEADLEFTLELKLSGLPRGLQRRLVRARALARGLMLDGSTGALAANDDYRALLDGLELAAIRYPEADLADPQPMPAPKRKKARSDA